MLLLLHVLLLLLLLLFPLLPSVLLSPPQKNIRKIQISFYSPNSPCVLFSVVKSVFLTACSIFTHTGFFFLPMKQILITIRLQPSYKHSLTEQGFLAS